MASDAIITVLIAWFTFNAGFVVGMAWRTYFDID